MPTEENITTRYLKNSNLLVLTTLQYPYGHGETFLDIEVKAISDRYDKIFIFPISPTDQESRKVPINVFVFKPPRFKKLSWVQMQTRKNLIKFIASLLTLKKINRSNISHLIRSNYHSLFIESVLTQRNLTRTVILYSYWFDAGNVALSMLKSRCLEMKLISRAHGFDLHPSRLSDYLKSVRNFQFKLTDFVFAVSQNGADVLKGAASKYESKINTAILGTFKPVMVPKISTEDKFIVVSCSNLIPIKRVTLIAQLLKKHQKPIHWVHFGTGSEQKKVEAIAKTFPTQSSYSLLGLVPNSTIHEFYSKQHVDVFINLSETEGLPVSIMEAVSYGIPVLATDVGGTKEIVNETTGVLIPKLFENKTFQTSLEHIFQKQSKNTIFRKSIREYYSTHYAATENFQKFHDFILANSQTSNK